MDGKGEAKAGTGAFTLPVTFPSRIQDPEGRTSPEELMAAILENRVVVCPDQESKMELDEWLYWKTRKATVPCYVEIVPLPKKTAGGKSKGKA